MEFLQKEYNVPQGSSKYMKFEEGENVFRVVGSAIVGWEDWTEDHKPVRYRFDQKPRQPLTPEGKIKHFWAFPVWNYSAGCVQVLQVTQAGIQKAMKQLIDDTDWGSPFEYDLKIVRTGKGIDTEYAVNPKPKKPLDEAFNDIVAKTPVNLEALFEGGDPFGFDPSEIQIEGTALPTF